MKHVVVCEAHFFFSAPLSPKKGVHGNKSPMRPFCILHSMLIIELLSAEEQPAKNATVPIYTFFGHCRVSFRSTNAPDREFENQKLNKMRILFYSLLRLWTFTWYHRVAWFGLHFKTRFFPLTSKSGKYWKQDVDSHVKYFKFRNTVFVQGDVHKSW